MDLMSGWDIRLVFTLPPRDSTLQYKRCVHLWNNFPCIITLSCTVYLMYKLYSIPWCTIYTVYLVYKLYSLRWCTCYTVYLGIQDVQSTLVYKLCSIPWCTICPAYVVVQSVQSKLVYTLYGVPPFVNAVQFTQCTGCTMYLLYNLYWAPCVSDVQYTSMYKVYCAPYV